MKTQLMFKSANIVYKIAKKESAEVDYRIGRKIMKAEIKVACSGWKGSHWGNNFFPEDIPHDWRLEYYSNEFAALMLTSSDDFDEGLCIGLEDGIDEEFRLLLPDKEFLKSTELESWLAGNPQFVAKGIIRLSDFLAVDDFPNLFMAESVKIELPPDLESPQLDANLNTEAERYYFYSSDEELEPKKLRTLAEYLLKNANDQTSIIYLVFSDSQYTVKNSYNLQLLSQML